MEFIVERRLAPLAARARPARRGGPGRAMRDATYWDGNGGIVTFAISAIDMALWDLKGRIEGRSLSDMLGGRRTTGCVPAPARSSTPTTWTASAQEFAGFRDQGYRSSRAAGATTSSIAFGRDEARDMAIAQAVRRAIGPDVEMICDVVALAGWTPDHAIRMARRLDDEVGLFWLEDPLSSRTSTGTGALHAAVDDAHLHRREGLDGRPLPTTHRLGRRRCDHGRSGQGRGRDRHLERHPRGGRGRARLERPLVEERAQHRGLAPPGRRPRTTSLLFELKPLPSPMQHELVRRPIEQVDGWVTRLTAPGWASRSTRPSCAATVRLTRQSDDGTTMGRDRAPPGGGFERRPGACGIEGRRQPAPGSPAFMTGSSRAPCALDPNGRRLGSPDSRVVLLGDLGRVLEHLPLALLARRRPRVRVA